MRFTAVAVSAAALCALACSDSATPPTTPSTVSSSRTPLAAATAERAADDAHTLRMYDSCDPATFNAVFNDPTVCIKQGHVPFDRFIAELTQTQKAAQWHFAPQDVELNAGENVFALNVGGEVHTFTRVAQFGGGIIPLLNDLTGNATVAPECTTLEADDFVAPGGLYTAELNTDEVQHFQCCIHPWMRADVKMKHLHS
jgi:hypothetical protein